MHEIQDNYKSANPLPQEQSKQHNKFGHYKLKWCMVLYTWKVKISISHESLALRYERDVLVYDSFPLPAH